MILIALGFFVRAVIAEVRSGPIIIDLIEVPKDLAEQGYTPIVMAQRLHSEIAKLGGTNTMRTALEEGFEVGGSQIDFAVPSAGVSFRNIVRYVRQQIGRPESRLRGEIVRERTTKLVSRPASDDSLDSDLDAPAATQVEKIRILLRTADGRAASEVSVSTMADFPALIHKAALAAANLADPYLLATFWFSKEQKGTDFTKTIESVRHCLSSTGAEKHDRAYVIWGNVAAAQRQYADAEEKYRRAIEIAPRQSRGHMGLGNLFRTTRRFDEAFEEYTKAARLERRGAAPRSSLGYVCNDRHKYAEAVPHFEKALKLNPRHVNSLNGIAWSFWKMNRFKEAEAAFSRATDIDPRYGWPYRNRALMLRAQRRYGEAIEYAKAAAETPMAAEALGTWADILLDSGDFSTAMEKYLESEKRNPALQIRFGGEGAILGRKHQYAEAIRVNNEAIDRERLYVNAWLHRAEAQRRLGQFDEAVDTCNRLIRIDPYLASAYVHKGLAIQSRNPDEAMSLFETAAGKDPAETWAWRCWGDALRKQHRYSEGISKHRRALESDRFDSYAHYGCGHILQSMGRENEADEHFRLAYELDGRNAQALRKMADIDLRAGRIAEARMKFERAIAEWPHIAALAIQQGQVLQSLGFLSEALASFDRALSLDERDPDALVGKAQVLKRLCHHNEAVTLLRLAVAVEPTHHSASRVLANTLFAGGESFDRVIEPFEAAHSLDPYNAGILLDWANLLSRDGRHAAAENKCRDAIRFDPYETRAHTGLGHTLLKQHRPLDAIDRFRAAAALDPFDPEPQYNIGQAFEAMKKWRDALKQFRIASELRPLESRFYVGCGVMLQRVGRIHDALDQYRRALEVDRVSSDAFSRVLNTLIDLDERAPVLKEIENLEKAELPLPAHLTVAAQALIRLGRFDKQKPIYQRALRMTPCDTRPLIGFADTIPVRFDESARRVLDFALKADATHTGARRSLGDRLARLGRANEALDRFARAEEQDPQDLDAVIDAARLLMTMAQDADFEASRARKKNDADRAAEKEQDRDVFYARADNKLRVIAERNPWETEGHRRRGTISLATAAPRVALEHFDAVIRLDPYDWRAYLDRSRAHFQLNERQKAIKDAKRAASRSAESFLSLTRIAEILNEFGESAEARTILKQASEIAPKNQVVIDLLAEIDKSLGAN
jgi:tetratricopeptide (TPR) repeat protein